VLGLALCALPFARSHTPHSTIRNGKQPISRFIDGRESRRISFSRKTDTALHRTTPARPSALGPGPCGPGCTRFAVCSARERRQSSRVGERPGSLAREPGSAWKPSVSISKAE
jgi:hypothetical protein